jgi:HEAT repeat protein
MVTEGGSWKSTLRDIRRMARAERVEAIRALGESGSGYVAFILQNLLDDADTMTRWEALDALAEWDDLHGRLAARACTDDGFPSLRARAAVILGEIGKRQDLPRLRRMLSDPDWTVRSDAAESLAKLGGIAAHPALKRAVAGDPHPVVRRDAAAALAWAEDRSMVPFLREALAVEQDPQARVGILEGLYAIGERDCLGRLLELLFIDHAHVPHAVVNVLRRALWPEDRPEAARALRRLLERDVHPGIRIDATITLEALEAASALPG